MSLEEQVIGWLAQQNVDVYLVGGCVRDRLLGRPLYDLDLAVSEDGLALARRLANHFQGAYYPLDAERDTGRAILDVDEGERVIVDVAGFRGPDLAADLADRDFTINALAVGVRDLDKVLDQHGGLADIEAGLIRPVSDHSIRSDPLRALRAVRQAAELGFALAPETQRLIRRDGGVLVDVSGERIRDEVSRLLAQPQAASFLDLCDDLGLLTTVFPELELLRDVEQSPPHHLKVLAHSLETVRALEAILQALAVSDGSEPFTASASAPSPAEYPVTVHRTGRFRGGVHGHPQGGLAKRRTGRHPGEAVSDYPPEDRASALMPFAGPLHTHLAQVIGEGRTRLVTLKLAALLHDTGKPGARSEEDDGRIRFIQHEKEGAKFTAAILRRLRFNRAEVRLGETIVRHHMRPLLLAGEKSVSTRAVYRFFRDTGEAGVEVLLHALADHQAIVGPDADDERWPSLLTLTARMLGDYWERKAERVLPPALISGHDLINEFGLPPGPRVGQVLEAVREAQVSGEVRDRDEALAWMGDFLRGEGSGDSAD